MGLYCGIDLHSNNAYYGIVDAGGKRVFKKRLPNDLPVVLETLAPFKEELEGLAVESTYNWYWLVDGLQAKGYPVQLANPAGMEQYSGLKHADDQNDAFFLAEILRLRILPEGYIYPKDERPVRDLLRRRMLLVQLKTVQVLSLQSLVSRETGHQISGNQFRQLKDETLQVLLPEEHLLLAGQTNLSVIEFLERKIGDLESALLKRAKLRPEYEKLVTVPGIGKILSLTIMYETGDIGRFSEVGNYTSYCRCASATRWSNQKEKGKNNRKNGNRYLAWAYVEAASFAIRCCAPAQSFYQRKKAKTKACVAMKALRTHRVRGQQVEQGVLFHHAGSGGVSDRAGFWITVWLRRGTRTLRVRQDRGWQTHTDVIGSRRSLLLPGQDKVEDYFARALSHTRVGPVGRQSQRNGSHRCVLQSNGQGAVLRHFLVLRNQDGTSGKVSSPETKRKV